MKNLLILFLCHLPLLTIGQVENVVLITMDGFRWEELFGGAVDSLMNDDQYVHPSFHDQIVGSFDADSPEERRQKLMPWFWDAFVTNGQVYGNRLVDNKVDVTNRFWFSYPGYNEILVGYSDPEITSNSKIYNKNQTVLEWLHEKDEFRGKVAAFGSWDVFPYIVNDIRSGIPVNAGFRRASGDDLSDAEVMLNEMQGIIPSPWSTVRLDAFTHHYALEYLKKYHPRVTYISYGETDDFAHDGRYEQYLMAANRTDGFLQELWEFLQSDPEYSGRTAMVITTDHGRGNTPKSEWESHGVTYEGSNAIWIAAMGPGIPARGVIADSGQFWQNQVASTVAKLLGYDYVSSKYEVGPPIKGIVNE